MEKSSKKKANYILLSVTYSTSQKSTNKIKQNKREREREGGKIYFNKTIKH